MVEDLFSTQVLSVESEQNSNSVSRREWLSGKAVTSFKKSSKMAKGQEDSSVILNSKHPSTKPKDDSVHEVDCRALQLTKYKCLAVNPPGIVL
jgi:hypothetical protein